MKNFKLFNITLLLLSIFSFSGIANAEYKMGRDYTRIDNPLPVKQDGIVEVMEVFWYGCSHCNQFRPVFDAWKKQQGDDVDTVHSPAMWNKPMIAHARIFYTAKAFLLQEKMHKEIFDAMHIGGQKLTSNEQVFSLFEKHGVSREDFDKTFDSFGIIIALYSFK